MPIHVHAHTCVRTCIHMCMYIYIYTNVNQIIIYIYVYDCIYNHIKKGKYTCAYIDTYVLICTYIHMNIYIYTYVLMLCRCIMCMAWPALQNLCMLVPGRLGRKFDNQNAKTTAHGHANTVGLWHCGNLWSEIRGLRRL
jgi:hypothetical protein